MDRPAVESSNVSGKNQKSNDSSATLSSCVISVIGRDIEVKTSVGETWAGTLKACSSNFDIGLGYARKLPIHEDHKDSIVGAIEKMEFKCADVVEIIVPLEEMEKKKAGIKSEKVFATDKQISDVKKGDKVICKDFEEWKPEDEDEDPNDWQVNSLSRSSYPVCRQKSSGVGGWAPEDMLKANSDLGVITSFKEDLSQYTTVEAIGNEEQKKMADKIASSIEQNSSSRRNADLENDDFERDILKPVYPNNNRNGNDFINASRRGPKFPPSNRGTSYQQRKFEKTKNTDNGSWRAEASKNDAAPMMPSSSGKLSASQLNPASSNPVLLKSTDRKTDSRVSPPLEISSIVLNNKHSVSIESHSLEQQHSNSLDQKLAAQKGKDESQKGESRAEGSSKANFVFNPDATPFVPTKQETSPAPILQHAQSAAITPYQSSSNSGMMPPVQMQQQSAYYTAPTTFQPSHSLPPPNSFVAGQQIIQNPNGFVNPQFFQQGGHPMVMSQSAVSHGYPSTANQTLSTSSIGSSHQLIPMANPLNYSLNNGSLQMVLPMHQMTYYPPVTSIAHAVPPPNFMPGQTMVMNAQHGQFMNQPQFFQQNNQ